MAVTIEQASANALAAYLTSQLTSVTVLPRWAEPSVQLPSKAITITKIGARTSLLFDPVCIAKTILTSTTAAYTWEVASIEQPIQLDVWATTDIDRDDIMARLDVAMNLGPAVTAPALGFRFDPIRDGVLLPLADGWPGTVDCYLDEPIILDTAEDVAQSQYRATFQGNFYATLTVTATSPRLLRINYQQALDGDSGKDQMTVSASGATYSRIP